VALATRSSLVIASEAKQSSSFFLALDCLVGFASSQ
jgi:hypothetical protein